jgi:hypothetical protein
MRNFFSLFAVVSLVALMVAACGLGSKSVKPSSDATPPPSAKPDSDRAKTAKPANLLPQQAKGALPSPDLARSGLPEGEPPPAGVDNLDQRAEVNQSAIEFAESVPNVKAVKTCFSKLYGGWNLDLFVGKGKKIDKQQFSWNGKSKEWEPTGLAKKEIPLDQLEYYLNTELADEKCFVLKK